MKFKNTDIALVFFLILALLIAREFPHPHTTRNEVKVIMYEGFIKYLAKQCIWFLKLNGRLPLSWNEMTTSKLLSREDVESIGSYHLVRAKPYIIENKGEMVVKDFPFTLLIAGKKMPVSPTPFIKGQCIDTDGNPCEVIIYTDFSIKWLNSDNIIKSTH